jgi:hypothetical protein
MVMGSTGNTWARAGLPLSLLLAMLPWAAPAAGQLLPDRGPVATTYGHGVHSFFAGEYQQAYDALSTAIDAGTPDPRAWYFRGLAALRMGRIEDAETDFIEGANRESAGVGSWPVARSLERVQGCDRLALERHRVRARVAALERDREAVRRRYSEIDEAQPEVLRTRRPQPLPQPEGDLGPFDTEGRSVPRTDRDSVPPDAGRAAEPRRPTTSDRAINRGDEAELRMPERPEAADELPMLEAEPADDPFESLLPDTP